MSATSFLAPRLDDTAQRLLWKAANCLFAGLGLAGSTAVAAGQSYNGNFWAFHAFTASVIAEITYSGGGGASAGTSIVAGDRIYGNITHLKLTSGTGELYTGSASV